MRSLGLCALACALALAGCGGGGGGGGRSGSGPGGGSLPSPTATVTVAVTSPAINASISQGDAYTATISGTWSATNLGSGSVYLQVTDSASTFTLPAIQSASGSTFTYSLPVAAGIASGARNGTLTVRACKDTSCTNVYSNASGSVAYQLTVSQVPEWETMQGNAAHNGYVPIQLDTSKFSKVWEWTVPRLAGADAAYISRPVTGSNGVYALGQNNFPDGTVQYGYVALEEDTGVQRWLAVLNDSSTSLFPTDAAVSAGRLYFGVANGSYGLMALDVGTGSTMFSSPDVSNTRSNVAPTPYGGSVFTMDYPPNTDPRLVVANGGTGGLQWTRTIMKPVEGKPFFAPAVDDQYVYYHNACCLKVLNRLSGAEVASIPNPNADGTYLESRYHQVLIGSRGNALAFAYTPTPAKRLLSSFNIVAKTREWTSAKAYLSSVAVANGVVYATFVENSQFMLHALDEATGQVLWTWSPPAADATATTGGNVIVTRNLVFFSSYNTATGTGKTWAVDLATHQAVWNYQMSGSIAISAKRMLYLSPYDTGFGDRLIAIKLR